MGVNFSTLLYLPVWDMFAVPIVVLPVASQYGAPSYNARGIYNTRELDVIGLDGALFSDQKTELDIREAEFAVLPKQNDRITIPADCNGVPLGTYEVIDADTNGVGVTCLTLRKWIQRAP